MVTEGPLRKALLARLDSARQQLDMCTDREFAIELVTQGLDAARASGVADGEIIAAAVAELNQSKVSDELRGLALLDRDLTDFERMIVALEDVARSMRIVADRFQSAELLPDRRAH